MFEKEKIFVDGNDGFIGIPAPLWIFNWQNGIVSDYDDEHEREREQEQEYEHET